MNRKLSLLLGWFALVASQCPAFAADATGTIVGRVFNPVTQEYVRDAEVTVAGANLSTYTADDGSFSLSGVPAGEVTLAVTYTGYEPASVRLTVGGRQTGSCYGY
jgi:hypothetical protein